MILRSDARWMSVALLILVTAATACVRRTATSDFGLSGLKPHRATQKAAAPDSSWRAIFQKQKQGAFDPLSDDPRVKELQARLKANPEDAAAHAELGAVYEGYRLYEAASAQYTEVLRITAVESGVAERALSGFSRCARMLGQTREAIPVLETFVKNSASAISWNELGLLYDAIGDLSAGEKAFKEAVALAEDSDRFHNNLGYNLLLQKKTDLAEPEFRRAVELNPTSATSRNNLGIILARRGDLQGALEQFQFAADAATAHNNLAVILLESGQYELSRDELIKALAIRHSFPAALENFKLVQERIRGQAEGAHSK